MVVLPSRINVAGKRLMFIRVERTLLLLSFSPLVLYLSCHTLILTRTALFAVFRTCQSLFFGILPMKASKTGVLPLLSILDRLQLFSASSKHCLAVMSSLLNLLYFLDNSLLFLSCF